MNEYILTEKTNLTAIANAIRVKTNSISSLTIGDMINAINNFNGGNNSNIVLGETCTVYIPYNGTGVTMYYLNGQGKFQKIVNPSNDTIVVLKNSILLADSEHFEPNTFIAPSNAIISRSALLIKNDINLEYASGAPT